MVHIHWGIVRSLLLIQRGVCGYWRGFSSFFLQSYFCRSRLLKAYGVSSLFVWCFCVDYLVLRRNQWISVSINFLHRSSTSSPFLNATLPISLRLGTWLCCNNIVEIAYLHSLDLVLDQLIYLFPLCGKFNGRRALDKEIVDIVVIYYVCDVGLRVLLDLLCMNYLLQRLHHFPLFFKGFSHRFGARQRFLVLNQHLRGWLVLLWHSWLGLSEILNLVFIVQSFNVSTRIHSGNNHVRRRLSLPRHYLLCLLPRLLWCHLIIKFRQVFALETVIRLWMKKRVLLYVMMRLLLGNLLGLGLWVRVSRMVFLVVHVVGTRILLHHLRLAEGNFDGGFDVFWADSSVDCHVINLGLEAQVLKRIAFLAKLFSTLGRLVYPLELRVQVLLITEVRRPQLGYGTHLSI